MFSNTDTSVSAVTIDEDRVTALKGTKNITFICSVTLSAPIGPVYKDLNVTWKHNGSKMDAMHGSCWKWNKTSTILLAHCYFLK